MKYLLDTCVLSELSIFDSQIAATALAHGMTMVTRNVDDFKFEGLAVINPFESA